MTDKSLKIQLEEELAKLQIFSPEYRRRKMFTYLIRTAIVVFLYVIFWKHQWVRWSLVIYLPLNLFSLFSIYGWSYLLQRKIERTKRKIEEADVIQVHPKSD